MEDRGEVDDDEEEDSAGGDETETLRKLKDVHRARVFSDSIKADIRRRVEAIRSAVSGTPDESKFRVAIDTLEGHLSLCPILASAVREAASTTTHGHMPVVRIPNVTMKAITPIGKLNLDEVHTSQTSSGLTKSSSCMTPPSCTGKYTVFDLEIDHRRSLFIAHYGQQGGVRGHLTVEETSASLLPCGLAGELVTEDRSKFMALTTSYAVSHSLALASALARLSRTDFNLLVCLPAFQRRSRTDSIRLSPQRLKEPSPSLR